MDLTTYLEKIREYPPLLRQEEAKVIADAKAGDSKALDLLIKSNLRFVVSVAKKYQNQGLLLDDLIAEGNLGLLKAFEKFDNTKDFKFITYAVWWIRQTILHALNEHSKLIRLPVNKINSLHKVGKIKEVVEQKLGREYTYNEIFDENPDLEDAQLYNYILIDIDEPQTEDDHDLSEVLTDLQYSINEALDSNQIYLKTAIDKLTDREKQIIKMYYGLGEYTRQYTLTEIGEALNLTRERIRQIKLIALDKFNKKKIRNLLLNYEYTNEL